MTNDQGPMTETAEPPPGCLVLLLRLSAGMTAEVVTGRGEAVAFAAIRQLADELLDALVNTVAAGYAVGPLDVAVLGYHTTEDGSPLLVSLLPDGEPNPRLVPITEIVEMPAVPRDVEGQPRKWAVIPGCEGEPCPSAALARVYQMVSVWLTGRYAARPPVVLHCTAADGLDDSYARIARSLGLLTTGYGPVRLLHYVFESGVEPVSAGNWSESLDESWVKLRELSGELPENTDAGKSARCGLAINDWDLTDLWDAVFSCSWKEDTIAWTEVEGGFSHARGMWAQKMGNTPEQWEDAFTINAGAGVAVVADGASTGIYCRAWADQLGKQFLAERPNTRDPVLLNNWINRLRSEWRSAINYDTLNWSKKAKVDSVGAAATLLGLEVGPANADGVRPWRACAVGDASLFWIRDGQLLSTFPVVAADQFGSAPLLIRSSPGFRTLAIAAEGTCQPGDRFVLATDAVAVRLFKSAALGPGPEWKRFETINQADWRAELDTLRSANDMVNDDCTLVVLRISGGNEEVEWASEPVVEETDREEQIPSPAATTLARRESAATSPQRGEVGVAETSASFQEQDNHITSPPHGGGEVAEQREALEAGEGVGTTEVSKPPKKPEPLAPMEDFVITPDVADLMIDLPHDPPADELADEPADERNRPHDADEKPKQPVEPPPVDEPPATRDGFPDSTDPGV
ncbi:MAG: hypothetical protein L0241_17505 [Planctomycetia bacterium]|nr:hypothetical protein [Planctomycetia bacterium]